MAMELIILLNETRSCTRLDRYFVSGLSAISLQLANIKACACILLSVHW
jgi:hypothetical protein